MEITQFCLHDKPHDNKRQPACITSLLTPHHYITFMAPMTSQFIHLSHPPAAPLSTVPACQGTAQKGRALWTKCTESQSAILGLQPCSPAAPCPDLPNRGQGGPSCLFPLEEHLLNSHTHSTPVPLQTHTRKLSQPDAHNIVVRYLAYSLLLIQQVEIIQGCYFPFL